MKRTSSVCATIQMPLFLLGSAWFDGAFDVEELPKSAPQISVVYDAAHVFHRAEFDFEPELTIRPLSKLRDANNLSAHASGKGTLTGYLTTGRDMAFSTGNIVGSVGYRY